MKLDFAGIGEEEIAFLDSPGEISRSFSALRKFKRESDPYIRVGM